ncbi:AAA family ATPase [Candidatus Micrarchaeota archaeon]|nr:AAA family ATPase [Candidatus Micrarchaeota archaeon]
MDKSTIVTHALESNSEGLKALEGISKSRFAYDTLLKVASEEEYFLGITGLRGIGKTVLLLQLAKATGAVYFSADDRNLRGVDLYDIIRALSEAGHKRIFIDEIHTKPDWDSDLKTVYGESLAYVAFSGSSAIQIKSLKADLSRRVVLEHLKSASFREWLSIKKGVETPLLTMEKLIAGRVKIAKEYGHAHKYLPDYYSAGGILYDAKTYFHKTILSIIETIAEKDFATIKGVDVDTAENFFKLLQLVACSRPMELSYSTIGETLKRNKVWVMRFLSEVEKTEAVRRIYPCGQGLKPFRKEAKYYMPFPYRSSLCASLNKSPDIGSLREEFFINHVDCCYLRSSATPTADFQAGGHTFEVGGQGKGSRQGADYIVSDGLDTSGNRIPLFGVGLLY